MLVFLLTVSLCSLFACVEGLEKNDHERIHPSRGHQGGRPRVLPTQRTLLADPVLKALAAKYFDDALPSVIGDDGREAINRAAEGIGDSKDTVIDQESDEEGNEVCHKNGGNDGEAQDEGVSVGVRSDGIRREGVGCDDEDEDDEGSDSRRRLAQGSTKSDDPWMYPDGGTYYHPIGVTLVSDRDDDLVYYTLDGSDPTLDSSKVRSGGTIGVYSSAIIKIAAGPGSSDIVTRYEEYVSDVVSGNFTIHIDGKCGKAVLVPYYTPAGYSGTPVKVELETSQYPIVRMHNLYTDWADFYSDGGTGPYEGQVDSLDMANDTSTGGLRGYWGGFSAKYNGTQLGFFSPMFDGKDYHGKAVQVAIDAFGTANNSVFCGVNDDIMEQDPSSNTSCVFKVLDLERVDDDLRGFSGGFHYDGKAYFVPTFNGRTTGTKLVRVNIHDFSTSTVQVLDLAPLDSEIGGFSGGFAWNGYGFLVPGRRIYTAPFGGIGSNLTEDGIFTDVNYPTANLAQHRRTATLTTPAFSGKLVRVDLSAFDLAGCSIMDLTKVDPDLRGFMGGFTVGKYGMLTPFKNNQQRGVYSGKIAMVDLEKWGDLGGVTSIDLTRKDTSLTGFIGGLNFGKYAVFMPYINGDTTHNSRQRSQSSKLVFVNMEDLRIEGVRVIDVAKQVRQQIPSKEDNDLRGFIGGFALGQHIYLSPHFNGVFFGKIVRLDVQDLEVMSQGGTPKGNDGMQVMDLLHDVSGHPEYAKRCGFSGIIHSYDASCVPENA